MDGPRRRARILPPLALAALALVLGVPPASSGGEAPSGPEPLSGFAAPASGLPLLDTLGDHTRRVTTRSPQAQRYFDQGLRFLYAFDQEAAYRSFARASELDPGCASCAWGMAAAVGPNVNVPVTSDRIEAGHAAARRALALLDGATEVERALARAMSARYVSPAPTDPEAVRGLDHAYARAMRQAAERFPDDPDVLALSAEASMLISPWDYWTEAGEPRPHVTGALDALQRAIALDPDHPGAHHLWIHAVEAGPHPERAVDSADVLGGLVPGAGHLVHMPSHIYARVGRYEDAVRSNERAIEADSAYRKAMEEGPIFLFYSAHNHHFLAFAAAMAGRGERALLAARSLLEEVPLETFCHMPEMDGMLATPVLVLVRFQRWDDLIAEPPPPSAPACAGEATFPRALWHMGRGLAFARVGRAAEAEEELRALRALRDGTDPSEPKGRTTSRHLLGIADDALSAALAEERGDLDEAVRRLRAAASAEDRLTYMEPPDWWPQARHALGAVLLDAGRPEEAERAYREDLVRHPGNGWALAGLARSLADQGRTEEAADAEERARAALPAPGEVPESTRW